MSQNGDFLPRSFAIGHMNSFIGAIDFQSGSLVQRTNAKFWDEILFTESVAGKSKDQADQPFHAGVQMQEPALVLARRGDLDDRSLTPISFAEIAQFTDTI